MVLKTISFRLFCGVLVCLPVAHAQTTSGVSEINCRSLASTKVGGSGATSFRVENNTKETLILYWYDAGKKTKYATIRPGSNYEQETYAGHLWVIDVNAQCKLAFAALSKSKGNVVFGKSIDYFALPRSTKVIAPPTGFGFDPFYKKYVNTSGIPVISSGKPTDKALIKASDAIVQMLSTVPEVKKALIQNKIRFVVMSATEKALDIPEHSDLQEVFPETDWNARASGGLGATLERPATTTAEDNILCYRSDPHFGESILVHEFGHTIMLGLTLIDKGFQKKIDRAYQNAKKNKLWQKTYAMTDSSEYWAEGVQSWFDTNLSANPANGIHNHIRTRAQLKKYDPELAKLLFEVFGEHPWRYKCN